jgi:hypothetical protein
MARNARVIRTVFEAGTGSYFADVDKAKAKIIDYGQAVVGCNGRMRENAAVVRALSGDLKGTNRELAMILTNSLGLGPVLSAAFKVAGPAILAVSVVDLGVKVKKFFDDMREMPARINTTFRDLTGSLRTADDELRVSNARLENEIAKLEGKPTNNLKTAIEETIAAADKLGEHLERNLDKALEDLRKLRPGVFTSAFQLAVGIHAPNLVERETAAFSATQKEDISFEKDSAAIRANAALSDKQKEALLKAAAERHYRALLDIQRAAREWYEAELERIAPTKKIPYETATGVEYRVPKPPAGIPSGYKEEVQGMLLNYQRQMEEMQDQLKNTDLQGKLGPAQDASSQRKKDAEAAKKAAEADKERLRFLARLDEHMAKEKEEAIETFDKWVEAEGKQEKMFAKADERRQDREKESADQLSTGLPGFAGVLPQRPSGFQTTAEIEEAARHTSEMDTIGGRGRTGASAREQYELAAETARARIAAAQEVLRHELAILDVNRDQVKVQEAKDKAAVATARAQNEQAERDLQIQEQQFEKFKQAIEPLINDISGQLADTLTGKKTNWGKSLENTGRGMLQSGIRGGFDRVLGLAKPDGSRSNPMWTRNADGAPSLPGIPGAGTPGNAAGGLGVLGLLTSLFPLFPHRAAGGPLSASGMTIVGENGPEILSGVSGYITSNADAHRMFGGGGVTVPVSVDARGSDIGVYHRAVDAARHLSQAAMSGAMRAQAERSRRVPV